MVRPEQSDRIAKGAQGRFVADLTRERCPGVEGLDVRENRMQSFVGLEPRAIRIRRQPLKAGSENRRYDSMSVAESSNARTSLGRSSVLPAAAPVAIRSRVGSPDSIGRSIRQSWRCRVQARDW